MDLYTYIIGLKNENTHNPPNKIDLFEKQLKYSELSFIRNNTYFSYIYNREVLENRSKHI